MCWPLRCRFRSERKASLNAWVISKSNAPALIPGRCWRAILQSLFRSASPTGSARTISHLTCSFRWISALVLSSPDGGSDSRQHSRFQRPQLYHSGLRQFLRFAFRIFAAAQSRNSARLDQYSGPCATLVHRHADSPEPVGCNGRPDADRAVLDALQSRRDHLRRLASARRHVLGHAFQPVLGRNVLRHDPSHGRLQRRLPASRSRRRLRHAFPPPVHRSSRRRPHLRARLYRRLRRRHADLGRRFGRGALRRRLRSGQRHAAAGPRSRSRQQRRRHSQSLRPPGSGPIALNSASEVAVSQRDGVRRFRGGRRESQSPRERPDPGLHRHPDRYGGATAQETVTFAPLSNSNT